MLDLTPTPFPTRTRARAGRAASAVNVGNLYKIDALSGLADREKTAVIIYISHLKSLARMMLR
jgi:hypothetical protein